MEKWIGITNIGCNINDNEAWKTKSGIIYRDGYSAKRRIFDASKDKYHDVTLNIIQSSQGIPLFEARIIEHNQVLHKVTCTNPTTTFKAVLNHLDVKIKGRLNGGRFFGLLSKEYENQVELSSEQNITEKDIEENSVLQRDILITPAISRNSTWVGVINYGVVINDPQYVKNIGSVQCRLQHGYEAIRKIKLKDERLINVHLKIEESINGPLFRAFTLNEPVVACNSLVIGLVVKEVFNKLNVVSNKKWSGFEYFGLTKSEVLNVLSTNPIPAGKVNDLDNDQRECNEQDYDILNDIVNIRKRNAGETSSLCRKAIKARNATIHKLVEFASFGDVKSKC